MVVLHDFVLHHLVAGMTVGRRDGHGYLDLMEREHGVVGRLLGHGVLDKRIPPLWESRPEDFPLATFVLEHATGLIVHSRYVRDRARAAGFDGPISVVPHPAWPAPTVSPERRGSGVVVGCFGVVNASKRIPELLRATADVRREHPELTLLLVGSTSPGFDLDRRLQRLGLADDGLAREGWVDESRLWALMAGSDVLVNLRHPTMGETSGSVIRGLSLGKPLVVSDVGWFSELPGDVALKVAPDDAEVETLTAALELLVARADVREAMGAAARTSHAASTTSGASPICTRPRSRARPAAARWTTRCSARSARLRPMSASRRTRPRRERSPAASPRSSLGRALRRIPTWAWLAAIVVGSTIVRAILGRDLVAPFIMVDEIIWSEVARGIADAGEPLLRDEPDPGYSIVYPLLISPVYALFDEPAGRVRGREDAQRAPHVARCRAGVLPRAAGRARRPRAARGAHGGRDPVHGVHGHGHDGERLLPALPPRRARPRARARAADAAPRRRASSRSSALAFATRVQAVALAPAVLLAPLVLARVRADGASARRSRRFRWLYGIVAGAALAVLVVPARVGRTCSAPTSPSASGRTTSARRFATCGGTSPSSRSTCS